MSVEIRALQPGDPRAAFHSGDEALDLYFHRYAGQNHFRHHIGVTYVATEATEVLGFVTVSAAQLGADDLPTGRRLPPYPVPVLRLSRLATSQAARGRGVGKALLRFSVELAERMRDEVGCVGLTVDAKADAVAFYQRFGFVPIGVVEGGSPVIPAPSPMFLPLGAVPRRR